MPGQTDVVTSNDMRADKSATGALDTVATRMSFPTAPPDTWRTLMFYEQVDARPPLLLRALLPVPIRTEGDTSKVGGEAMCLYESGHLVKRTTRIEAPDRYEFDVIEQSLSVGGAIELAGGSYELHEIPTGTDVVVTTRYTSRRRPRWLWRPIEAFVCHMFHRFLLREMRRRSRSA
jgi:hypothetical protein